MGATRWYPSDRVKRRRVPAILDPHLLGDAAGFDQFLNGTVYRRAVAVHESGERSASRIRGAVSVVRVLRQDGVEPERLVAEVEFDEPVWNRGKLDVCRN